MQKWVFYEFYQWPCIWNGLCLSCDISAVLRRSSCFRFSPICRGTVGSDVVVRSPHGFSVDSGRHRNLEKQRRRINMMYSTIIFKNSIIYEHKKNILLWKSSILCMYLIGWFIWVFLIDRVNYNVVTFSYYFLYVGWL